MLCSAQSERFCPRSASALSFTSNSFSVSATSAPLYKALLEAGASPNRVGFVGLLPGEAGLGPPKVSKTGCGSVDGTPEIEVFNDLPRLEAEVGTDQVR